jgi:hypothetical protein
VVSPEFAIDRSEPVTGGHDGADRGAAVLAAVTRPLDRAEMADVVSLERMRRRIVADATPIAFDAVDRDAADVSAWPVARDVDQPESVGTWAARSAIAAPFGRVLHRVARAVGGDILELGTGSGLSAGYLACGVARSTRAGRVVSVEPHAVLARRARVALDATFPERSVHLVQGAQEDCLDVLLDRMKPDVVHVDSDHTVRSMRAILGRLRSADGPIVVCLDDIRWSEGMTSVWDDLRGSTAFVSLIIDLGLWGIVTVDPVHRGAPGYRRLDPPTYLSGATAARIPETAL